MATVWVLDVEDATLALAAMDLVRQGDYDAAEALGDTDPATLETRTYKTRRGAAAFVERFASDLRQYMVVEHYAGTGEIVLTCYGKHERYPDADGFCVRAYPYDR